jgi:ketosteroid isomerase-like protein
MDPLAPMKQVVTNIIGGGESEDWCVVEMVNEGRTKSGERYDQTYAWCCRWEQRDGEWRIVQVRAYLDSGLVDRVVAAGEKEK